MAIDRSTPIACAPRSTDHPSHRPVPHPMSTNRYRPPAASARSGILFRAQRSRYLRNRTSPPIAIRLDRRETKCHMLSRHKLSSRGCRSRTIFCAQRSSTGFSNAPKAYRQLPSPLSITRAHARQTPILHRGPARVHHRFEPANLAPQLRRQPAQLRILPHRETEPALRSPLIRRGWKFEIAQLPVHFAAPLRQRDNMSARRSQPPD